MIIMVKNKTKGKTGDLKSVIKWFKIETRFGEV